MMMSDWPTMTCDPIPLIPLFVLSCHQSNKLNQDCLYENHHHHHHQKYHYHHHYSPFFHHHYLYLRTPQKPYHYFSFLYHLHHHHHLLYHTTTLTTTPPTSRYFILPHEIKFMMHLQLPLMIHNLCLNLLLSLLFCF